MPRIFDNIEKELLPALRETIKLSDRADFCVGYFNLRGWRQIDSFIESWSGEDEHCCRLLVGMQRPVEQDLRQWLGLTSRDEGLDNQTAIKFKKQLAIEFRQQLALGVPTDDDEAGLRRLAVQIRAKKVRVKLYLRHPLHAKLYLLFRSDPINPIVAYLGSSNLTLSGLSKQGELNVDVLEVDAGEKLKRWFEDRWNDRWCIDISTELAEIIESSWARSDLLPPYHIYLKIAYHLSREARRGLAEFKIPREFGDTLFEFQTAAVRIAAHHLNKRGGVLIGDVVGLGKTLMATALAKIFQEDHLTETLIICPKNLVTMWEDYIATYRLVAKVMSLSEVLSDLPELRRYRLVLLDESHNLRNPEGKRYRAIRDYIEKNDSRCILLSATPYNKTYLDLSAQLRLFIPENKDLGIRPEMLLAEISEPEFIRRHQCPVRSIQAFEKSPYPDDWRELMRLYMVRRTRSFIVDNYADTDPANGRKYLTFSDGTRSYFPVRKPKSVKFKIDDTDLNDPYGRLHAPFVINTIANLSLPRYGLGNYESPAGRVPRRGNEEKILEGLSRAGTRLMGFCVSNLFKRLESGGPAFIQSLERHILRNFVFIHAIENDLELPIGTQAAELLDTRLHDEDAEATIFDEEGEGEREAAGAKPPRTEAEFRAQAAEVYKYYTGPLKSRFKWLRAALFIEDLKNALLDDARKLIEVVQRCGEWDPARDAKLDELVRLLAKKHKDNKVLIFTQFADTVRYLEQQLRARGVEGFAGVTGDSDNPTELAWRFSPVSNHKRDQVSPRDELRILISTDVLSEGQNLQDCSIIVNYDLPWAIIRLIQRAGRVDRIGQKATEILCYSFLPADGVERIINLRGRVRQRLAENAEVVGSDEFFFDEDRDKAKIIDLYHENAAVLEGDADGEVDLSSHAYQIWKNATDGNPALRKAIEELPDVVFSTRSHSGSKEAPEGVLVYLRTGDGNDALAWLNEAGEVVTQSQLAILNAAKCEPETPAIPRHPKHHTLVARAVDHLLEETKQTGGQLGRPSGARFRTYERLLDYSKRIQNQRDLFITDDYVRQLDRALQDIYQYPLQQTATDTLNRQLKTGISDEDLALLVVNLREEDRLCVVHEDHQRHEARIICSLGLFPAKGGVNAD